MSSGDSDYVTDRYVSLSRWIKDMERIEKKAARDNRSLWSWLIASLGLNAAGIALALAALTHLT